MSNLAKILLLSTAVSLYGCGAVAAPGKQIDKEAIEKWGDNSLLAFGGKSGWTARSEGPSWGLQRYFKNPDLLEATYPELVGKLDEPFLVKLQKNGKTMHQLSSHTEFTGAKFSPSAKWFAAVRPAERVDYGDEVEKKLVLVDLATGDETIISNVAGFEFAGGALFIQKDNDASPLLRKDLASGNVTQMGPVSDFAVTGDGSNIIWTVSSDDGFGNGLFISPTNAFAPRALDSDAATYQSLLVEPEGDALTVGKLSIDESSDPEILAISGLGGGNLNVIEIDGSMLNSDKDMVVYIPEPEEKDPFAPPVFEMPPSFQWSDDRSAVLFQAKERQDEEDGGADYGFDYSEGPEEESEEESRLPDLALWHWKQAEIPNQEEQDAPGGEFSPPMSAVYWVSSEKAVQLREDEADYELANYGPEYVSQDARYTLGIGNYDMLERIVEGLTYRTPTDIYVIDTKDPGEGELLLEDVAGSNNALSPDGKYFAYYDKGHYHLYDIEARSSVNLTEGLGSSFRSTDDDNIGDSPAKPPLWLESGGLILRDNWDIWYLPELGKADTVKPVRLTKDGAETRTKYSIASTVKVDSAAEALYDSDTYGNDTPILEDEFVVHVYKLRTREQGLVKYSIPDRRFTVLAETKIGKVTGEGFWDPIQFYETSAGREYYVKRNNMGEQTVSLINGSTGRSTELFEDDWNNSKFRKKYAKPAGVEVLNYTCSWGRELQGSVVLPANYRKGKKYPTVVIIYESVGSGEAEKVFDYQSPSMRENNIMDLASRGYAIFKADMGFETGRPGKSGMECMDAALDEIIEAGIADPDKIGLHGHSWGGYQAMFYPTQTDRFAGAIAGAGLSDLIAMTSTVYWGSNIQQSMLVKTGQGRMGKTIWEDWMAHVENSALYYADKVNTPMLILHNEEDEAVPFRQGLGFFFALQRLEKPSVLLQYRKNGHGIYGGPDLEDYRQRNFEFWDHFLKGNEAPKWWSDGIKPDEMVDHLAERFPDPLADEE